MKIEYGPDFEKSLKRLLRQERWSFINPFEYWRRAKRFVQRGKNGYSDPDLWNLNDYIARSVLAYLEIEPHGWPGNLKTMDEWKDIRAEIKWLMQEFIDDDTPMDVVISSAYQKRWKKAKKLFGEYWMAMWD